LAVPGSLVVVPLDEPVQEDAMARVFHFPLMSALLLFWALAGADARAADVYGTTEPFASEAIYFVLTDRFVDADGANNHALQGGPNGTWQRRLPGPGGQEAFVGYMGGDFKGVYDNADYIGDLGFTAVWISPIVDNPDEAFTGGSPVSFGAGVGTDGGKTGYHGYWGVDFFRVDEHLESPGFSFQEFTSKMQDDHNLKIVLDIVGNHGSPSWGMQPVDQPKFGEIYRDGTLVADHQNLQPGQLDPAHQPLHAFFNKGGNLAQLSDLAEDDPAVLDYLADAYLQWIDAGADAFRVDTIAWMPHRFWKALADRIRARHPGFFMFGENFNSDAGTIAQHQRPENGGISVLDFPGKDVMRSVFEQPGSDYGKLSGYLHLSDCTYTNPYELATFYDNHDMARMNASDNGFIDAHNWLFTARGIPVVYYGSEAGFMRGKAEHSGNRNYFGPANIAQARNGEIYRRLARIAGIRLGSVALQRGVQVNLQLQGDRAAFYRVYQKDGESQTALVLLNKGDQPADFRIAEFVSSGTWRDAANGEQIQVAAGGPVIETSVGPHDVRVLLLDDEVNHPGFAERLAGIMRAAETCALGPVSVEPDPPKAGGTATIGYRRALGDRVALHWGIDNWSGSGTPIAEVPMTADPSIPGHRLEIEIPDGAGQLDFVFHNLTRNSWDTNGGQDWHFQVQSNGTGPGPGPGPKHQTRFGTAPELRLTGEAFSSWDPANDTYALSLVGDFLWQATIAIDRPLINTPYKLTLDGGWTVNWGGGAGGLQTSLPRGGANATATLDAGTYELTVEEGDSVASPVRIHWRPQGEHQAPWWTQTNIYQVYVEQFGGTLKGLTQHLDHLERLGAKTIWLMPIFRSMSDHGYDTTDYYAIREDYGTIEDLRDLVAAAEQRGMRVILDLVINHVGADHPWFSSDDPSERRDRWFVWSDTDKGWNKPWGGDGGPQLTWFGDPQAHLDRDGDGATNDDDFFYAVFSPTMPDFNYNDPTVRDELIEQLADVMAFWIEEAGVHGFRCDAVRYIVENGPHSDQRKDQPETHALWKTLRARLAEIDPEAILLAEAPTEEYDQMLAYYGEGDEFHSAFHFKLPWVLLHTIDSGRRPAHLLGDLYAIQANLPPRTQDTIFLSNHDQFAGDRVASQLGEDPAKIRAAAALYLLLSGNPAIYYGEEIGMTGSGSDAAIRGPMDFADADAQRQEPGSLLNHYTRLLRIRDRYDALRGGISYFVPSRTTGWDCAACESDRLALIREYFGEKVLVIHNFAPGAQALHLDLSAQATGLEIPDGTGVHGLMGGGTFAPITGANRQLYPVGTIPGRGTRVLFLGDIESYRQADGTLLTYENAVGGPIPPPARIQVAFRCENGMTVVGQSVYAVGDADALGGGWRTAQAPRLAPTAYPTWTGTIELPASSCVEWKCIIRDEQGSPPIVRRWQPGPNNQVCTPATGSASTTGRF
jgi:cyclomaltodextrin glucanotransferase